MAFKVMGGRLIAVFFKSTKKAQKRARNAKCVYDGTEIIKAKEWANANRGSHHPFASARAALRGMRRAQGGPGITEGSRPVPRQAPSDFTEFTQPNWV